MYIFFVNSLNHTGKDTLIKLPSNLVKENNNIYLDFSPVEMWSHSLIEYTALEANIYFAYIMYAQNTYNLVRKGGILYLNRKDISDIIKKIGKKILL